MSIVKRIAALGLSVLFLLALTACGSPSYEVIDEEIIDEEYDETEAPEPEEEETYEEAFIEETEPETEAEEPETTEASEKKAGTWVDAYKSVIESGITEGERPDCSFALIYLDDDDVPELAVQPNDFHMAQGELYMFDGSKAVDLGVFGSWGQISYVPKTGIIISGFTAQGTDTSTIYEYKDGKINELCNCTIESVFDDASAQYYLNGEKVSEAEYNAEMDKYGLDGVVAAPNPGAENTYPLSRGGVDSFVSDFG